jgi:hypothetical protein
LQREHEPEKIIALFAALAEAEATLHALQEAGVPYPAIRMGTHAPAELDQTEFAEQAASAGVAAPEQFWSLALTLDPQWGDKAGEVLKQHAPFAIARADGVDLVIDDVDQGAVAWRHYVFETPFATDTVGEFAGTTGNTGVISSGVFTEGALAEGNPPAKHTPTKDERPSDADTSPTSDTMTPKTSTDRSRPETELKD